MFNVIDVLKNEFVSNVFIDVECDFARIEIPRYKYFYCLDLLNSIDYLSFSDASTYANFEKVFLNGASDWFSYSWDGNSLIFEEDLFARFNCSSDLERFRLVQHMPLFDIQANSLLSACSFLWQFYCLYVFEKYQTKEVC